MIVNLFFEKKKYKLIFDYNNSVRLLKKYAKSKLINQHNFIDNVINYNFVSSKRQIEINNEHLNHNYNTDIITFNLSDSNDKLYGDIYISLKQIRKNAKRYNADVYQEINRVVIHGLLHLLGYNDKSKNEVKIMRKEENKFLKYINNYVPRGTYGK